MDTSAPEPMAERQIRVQEHSAAVRLTHWLNALCLIFLLASGLQIFNAHPRLYLGQFGADNETPVIEIASERAKDTIRGSVRLGGLSVDTTGFLGSSKEDGSLVARAFPSWLTLPSYHDLGAGRRAHLTFAWLLVINGLLYMAHGFWSEHFRRDLLPTEDQLNRRHLWQEIKDHVRLRFAKGEEARRYNTLQKMTYLVVVFVLLPLVVASGLAMSPAIDAAFPVLPELLGGRATARTLHFLTAFSLVAFVVVHLVMVAVSGAWNNLRSMITGRYAIADDGDAT
jgi:thiosulfate reductase cytochrome b subunit